MKNSVRIVWLGFGLTGMVALAGSQLPMGTLAPLKSRSANSHTALIASAPGSTPEGAMAGNAADTSVSPFQSSIADAATGPPSFSVTVSPKLAAIAATSQTQQFTATFAGNTKNTSVTWSVDGVPGGNGKVGTISASGLYTTPTSGGIHIVSATSVAVPKTIASATIAVTALPGVFTYHNDRARDGANTQEYALKPSTVRVATFGKLFACAVDGAIYAQPLWVRGLGIAGGTHNVIFVATQHDSVYAFDADNRPCLEYWHVNLLDRLHGGIGNETPVNWSDIGKCNGDIFPEIGVTGTPVIDPSTNTIYLVSASESNPTSSGNCSASSATFYHRMHAIELATGCEKFNAPVTIAASLPGKGDGSSGGIVSFNSQLQHQRSGLALAGAKVYVAFAAHEDATPFHGWVLSYKASDVQQQVAVFNTTPNGLNGADGGVWAGGGAPAVDKGGDIYVTTGNGVFDQDSPTPASDYGDSILRLRPFRGTTPNGMNLQVVGWFTPSDQLTLAQNDTDLGSGGVVLLPNQPSSSGSRHLLTQVGKDGVVYLIDRANMGQYSAGNNNVQSFPGPSNGLWGTPALWHNNLYTGGSGDSLKQFSFDPTTEFFNPTFVSQSEHVFGFPGTTPSLSSQREFHGIVWAIDVSFYGYASPNADVECSSVPIPSACTGPAILHAYDATNLAVEYWNSSLAAGNRDQAGVAVKFVPPTVANGKVYVGTQSELDVYGLLPN